MSSSYTCCIVNDDKGNEFIHTLRYQHVVDIDEHADGERTYESDFIKSGGPESFQLSPSVPEQGLQIAPSIRCLVARLKHPEKTDEEWMNIFRGTSFRTSRRTWFTADHTFLDEEFGRTSLDMRIGVLLTHGVIQKGTKRKLKAVGCEVDMEDREAESSAELAKATKLLVLCHGSIVDPDGFVGVMPCDNDVATLFDLQPPAKGDSSQSPYFIPNVDKPAFNAHMIFHYPGMDHGKEVPKLMEMFEDYKNAHPESQITDDDYMNALYGFPNRNACQQWMSPGTVQEDSNEGFVELMEALSLSSNVDDEKDEKDEKDDESEAPTPPKHVYQTEAMVIYGSSGGPAVGLALQGSGLGLEVLDITGQSFARFVGIGTGRYTNCISNRILSSKSPCVLAQYLCFPLFDVLDEMGLTLETLFEDSIAILRTIIASLIAQLAEMESGQEIVVRVGGETLAVLQELGEECVPQFQAHIAKLHDLMSQGKLLFKQRSTESDKGMTIGRHGNDSSY